MGNSEIALASLWRGELTTNPKRLLFISAHLGGGAGKAISGILARCKDKYNVMMMMLEPPRETKYFDELLRIGIQCNVETNFQYAKKCIEDSDVTVLNWWGHPLTIRLLQYISGSKCRLVIWSHVNGCFYPLLPADFLKSFCQIMFSSHFSLKNELWDKTDLETIANKATIVYGMGNFKPELATHKVNYIAKKERFKIGYVGTLSYEKLNERFLDFCCAVVKVVPKVEFWMVGSPSTKLLNGLPEELKTNFFFTGYKESVNQMYPEFDCFGYLLKSNSYATTENVLLEAMAAGLPIIVLNNPVEKEIIKDGINGFVVNDSQQYAEKVLDLYRNENKRVQIGLKARDYVIANYDSERNFLNFCDCIDRSFKSSYSCSNFKDLFGSGFEAFCFFAGIEKNKLISEIESGSINQENWSMNLGEQKGGVAQYCKYFPEDNELAKLKRETEKIKK